MTPSTRGSLLGLAFILLVAVAFAAGMRWNEYAGTGRSAHSCEPKATEARSMGACPMMGMDHGALAAPVKNASEPAATGGCPMAETGCCSTERQGTKQADVRPLDNGPVTGEQPGATGEPAMKTP